MTAPQIRTAILGYGVAGSLFHAPFIATQADYALKYIVTSNPARAAAASRRYPWVSVLPHADEVFDRAEELDLVVLATPPATHLDLATAALDHELDVVVDKPFATSTSQAQTLIDHAQRTGQRLTVFQNRRWDSDFVTLANLIADHRLGDVLHLESRFEWWKPAGQRGWKATTPIDHGGGILFDLGTHLIDQAVQLFGAPERVVADVTRRDHGQDSDADDDTVLMLTHRGGIRTTLTMTSWAARPGPRFHLRGTRGTYTKWSLDPQEAALARGAQPTDPGFGSEPADAWGSLTDQHQHSELVPPQPSTYAGFYQRLAAAITRGDDLPVDPNDALAVLQIIERAHQQPPSHSDHAQNSERTTTRVR